LATPGFIPPLLAFVTSIAVTNVVGAFMDLVGDCAGIDPGRIWDETASMEYMELECGGSLLQAVVFMCFPVLSTRGHGNMSQTSNLEASLTFKHPHHTHIFFFHQVSIV